MDITTATPAEIDTELAPLLAEYTRLADAVTAAYAEGDEIAAGERTRRTMTQVEEVITKATARMAELAERIDPLRAEFERRGGWRRWYLVTDGHLHRDVSSYRCSRTPYSDQWWMTDHSGRSAAEMIELAGDRVCTVCFENAPVEPRPATARFMTPSEAERAAYREQAARDRVAKKAAQITTPEGGELIVGSMNDHLKTERAAWNRAMTEATAIAWYGNGNVEEEREIIATCLAALAHRRGVTVESLREELNKKIAAKGKREGFEVLATV